jgi:hypothetical protein
MIIYIEITIASSGIEYVNLPNIRSLDTERNAGANAYSAVFDQ